jgi:hypothetical protein
MDREYPDVETRYRKFFKEDDEQRPNGRNQKTSLSLFAREGKRILTLAMAWFLSLDKDSILILSKLDVSPVTV